MGGKDRSPPRLAGSSRVRAGGCEPPGINWNQNSNEPGHTNAPIFMSYLPRTSAPGTPRGFLVASTLFLTLPFQIHFLGELDFELS